MKVNVTGPTGTVSSFTVANDENVAAIKKIIHDHSGIPIEYQNLAHVENTMLDDSAPLESLSMGQDELSLHLLYKISGSGAFGGGPSIRVVDFECFFRCMCCFSGIDGEIEKCQWLCVKCQCNIL